MRVKLNHKKMFSMILLVVTLFFFLQTISLATAVLDAYSIRWILPSNVTAYEGGGGGFYELEYPLPEEPEEEEEEDRKFLLPLYIGISTLISLIFIFMFMIIFFRKKKK